MHNQFAHCFELLNREGAATEVSVGTFYGVGRNYREHAQEMNAPLPEVPLIFIKPPASYLRQPRLLRLPAFSQAIHHEVEVAVVIGEEAVNIAPSEAARVILGYGVALDLTARDVQQRAKQAGEPWALAKGFYGAAPVSQLISPDCLTHVDASEHAFEFSLHVNGQLRQRATTHEMIFKIETLISYLSHTFTLRRGDCILTGTPQGVGPLHSGDQLEAVMRPIGSAGPQVTLQCAVA